MKVDGVPWTSSNDAWSAVAVCNTTAACGTCGLARWRAAISRMKMRFEGLHASSCSTLALGYSAATQAQQTRLVVGGYRISGRRHRDLVRVTKA
jgi:hypothetical protein